ncbi:MAG: NAD(P)-binding domain-containing protein [Bradymonadia bacterium]
MNSFGIIGDGSWGLALSKRLVASGHEVTVAGLAEKKRTPKGVKYTNDLPHLLASAERIVVSVPISDIEGLFKGTAPHFRAHHRVVSTARGLTPRSHLRASEVIRAQTAVRQVAVLAGAADAKALAQGEPVALVVGSAFTSWVGELQEALSSSTLRVYSNPDMVGVELANIAATVMGVVLGAARSLALGPAAEATALTRALAEMERVITGLGGQPATAYGLAGLGVLAEMVYSGQGAAFRAGNLFAQNKRSQAVKFGEVREATRTLARRVKRQKIDAPIVQVVHKLFEGTISISEALALLMERPQINESA